MTTTTITAIITGTDLNLEMVKACAIKYASNVRILNGYLRASWIIETSNYDNALTETMDCISLFEIENWNCELKSIA